MPQSQATFVDAPAVHHAVVQLPAALASPEAPYAWALAPLGGIPLICRHLAALEAAGVRAVTLQPVGDGLPAALSDLAARFNRRFAGRDADRAPFTRAVVLDGRRLFDPSLLADAARQAQDTNYVDAFGASVGLTVAVLDAPPSPDAARRVIAERQFAVPADTPAGRSSAARALRRSLVKETDGWVSRTLNRPISTRISLALAGLPVHPDVVTIVGFLIAVASAVASATGTYAGFAVGGVLFHVASVLDGVDGELARLTFRSSRRGQWLDTIADDASNLVYFAGLTVGTWRAYASPVLWGFGVATVVIDAVAVGILYWHMVSRFDSATLLAYQPSLERAAKRSAGQRWALRLQFMSRRDSYALMIMALGLAGAAWVTLVVTPLVIASVLLAAAWLLKKPVAVAV